MNFVDTRDQLVNIAQIVRRCPTITLMRAFTKAYRDWAGQTQYIRQPIAGETTANVREYALGSDPYQDIVAVFAVQASILNGGTMQYWPLVPSDPSYFNPNTNAQQPRRYAYIPQAQIALDPIPDVVYNLLVTVITQPKEGAISIPETALIKYRSGIESGALAYLHSIPGQPWSSPVLAEARRREFQSSVNNARAEVQRGFNTGSVRVQARAFVR